MGVHEPLGCKLTQRPLSEWLSASQSMSDSKQNGRLEHRRRRSGCADVPASKLLLGQPSERNICRPSNQPLEDHMMVVDVVLVEQ